MKSFAVTEKLIARFWAKVDKAGPEMRPGLGPCWVWTASKLPKGYGQFSIAADAYELAHRVSFVIENGRGPEGGVVRHRCDNPSCVRPSHLREGTLLDNNRDQVRPGRTAKGVKNRAAKLSEEQVAEIRQRFAAGELQGKLAREFGVTQPAVSLIVNGRNWRHVA
jgi:hypothetical protein